MPARSRELRVAVARAGAATRWQSPDPDIQRDLAVERISQYVQRVLAQAPPLTQEQRDRVATLLRGGGR